jgi:outer membrane lipoprotein SlyB
MLSVDLNAGAIACTFNPSPTARRGATAGKIGALAPALSHVASLGGYSGSIAGAVAGQVASTAIITAANVSDNVKAKDQLTLDMKLQAPGNAVAVIEKQYKAKAQSNGEDIISPIMEQAAQAIPRRREKIRR